MTSSEASTDPKKESAKGESASRGFLSTLAGFITGRRKKSTLYEYIEALVVAVVLAVFIRTFAFQAFRIPTGSMEDTLLVGDYLFVNKFLYGAEVPFTGGKRLPDIRAPRRGDIIVFRYPKDLSQDYIKRCVAVAGDTLEYREKVLYVNGEAQAEDFTIHRDGQRLDERRDWYGPVVVPEGHLFMMGDNRDRSADSRSWGFLDTRLLRGKAEFIYWSWDSSHSRPRLSRILDLIR